MCIRDSTTIEEILDIVKGPDFPTGGTIIGKLGIEEAYRTGRAKIKAVSYTHLYKGMYFYDWTG